MQFPYYIAKYAWLFVILLGCGIGVLTPYRQTIPVISSQNINEFDASKDPLYFSHMSDLHLSSVSDQPSINFRNALGISDTIGVRFNIITGDIADNYGDNKYFVYGQQYLPDYQIYWNMSSGHRPIIDLPGNHDEYALYTYKSYDHYFLNHSHTYNRSDDLHQFMVTFTRHSNISFVILNPFRYPTGRSKVGFWARPSTEFLDQLEHVLLTHNEPVFVVSHFPALLFLDTSKSTSGKNFREIMSIGNVQMFLSGHLHPKRFVLYHHNNYLEAIGPDMKSNARFGIVTIDNGQTVYHDASANLKPRALLTYPKPMSQLAQGDCFNNREGTLRLLSFNGENKSINVRGALNGTMVFERRLNSHASLYTLNYSLSPGKHHLSFTGDADLDVDIFIGDHLTMGKEKMYDFRNVFVSGFGGLIALFLVILYIAFPIRIQLPVGRKMIEWYQGNSAESYWIVTLLFGFIALREQFLSTRKAYHWLMFLVTIAPLLLPTTLLLVEGYAGTIWLYGYVINGHCMKDIWGPFFVVFYFIFVVLPVLFCTLNVLTQAPWYSYIFPVLLLIGDMAFLCTMVTEASGLQFAVFSPLFVIIPVICIVTLIWTAPSNAIKGNELIKKAMITENIRLDN